MHERDLRRAHWTNPPRWKYTICQLLFKKPGLSGSEEHHQGKVRPLNCSENLISSAVFSNLYWQLEKVLIHQEWKIKGYFRILFPTANKLGLSFS